MTLYPPGVKDGKPIEIKLSRTEVTRLAKLKCYKLIKNAINKTK